MEHMGQPYLKLVEECIVFTRQFLNLPKRINIYFEDCPSDRFPTEVNAAEVNAAESDQLGNLWFNKMWFTGEDRWNNHKDDIEFFVFHELRHMHQFSCIDLFLRGEEVNETTETIQNWQHGFAGYTRNVGGESQDINLSQDVEIDANAYAVLLVNLYHIGDDLELHFSVPEKAMDIAMNRINRYQTKPEIVRYLHTVQGKSSEENSSESQISKKQMPIRKTKIGRNEPCPCGSGLKYKKCTCKEYHS